MTSTIKVNNIQNQCGANIINENSNTITIGASGDTIALASGASQTGFGRTGSVDWQTTKKTTSFTAVSGEGYFVDTGGGVVTVTLPASPSAGDIVYVKDYDGNFGTNKCTIARNGSNIRGATNNFNLEKNNSGAVFIYVDATEGWQIFIDGSDADAQLTFIQATGGTEAVVCTNFKIHTFTGPGTFTITSLGDGPTGDKVDYMVIGGGGSGGVGNGGGGGGGAGGLGEEGSISGCWTATPLATPSSLSVTATAYPITVGAGGAGKPSASASQTPTNIGNSGNASTFDSITSAGGGGGGGYAPSQAGLAGGSGGGGAKNAPADGGAGNTPSVSPPQGNPGGNQTSGPGNVGGGGGGAGGQGESVSWPSNRGGNGGVGVTNTITGSPVGRAGGGGSNAETGDKRGGTGGFFSGGGTPLPETPAPGNSPLTPGFGGGNGSSGNECGQTGVGSGTANTGGGGGGSEGPAPSITSGSGGSGIVVIRYKFQ
jgi:hypothetical protein